jgi:hypothetical protein
MADPRRLYLGDHHDRSGTTKALVAAASPHWVDADFGRFERMLLDYKAPRRPDLSAASSKRTLNQRARMTRLGLLKALPEGRLSEAARKLIREEVRVFPQDVEGVQFDGAGWISSPMSAEAMAAASVADILRAFAELPDATDWDHPRRFLTGGNIELSRAFAELAKTAPDKTVEVIAGLPKAIGERAAGYALDALSEAGHPDLVFKALLDTAGRGFDHPEYRSSAARGLERLVDRKIIIPPVVTDLLEAWLAAPTEAAEPEPEIDTAVEEEIARDLRGRRGTSSQDDVRSILWDSLGFGILPGGAFPVLSALTRALMLRKEPARVIEIWTEHLERPEDPKIWQALLRLIPFLRPAGAPECGRLIARLFERYPALRATREGVRLLADAHWWAPDVVHRELLALKSEDDPWQAQAYGELCTLIATVQPDLAWAQALLSELLDAASAPAMRTGAAFAAVNLWSVLPRRKAAARVLLAIIPHAGPKTWSAVFDLFRLTDELSPDPPTLDVLAAMALHVRNAGRQTSTFVIERLQGLLPHAAELVGALAEALLANWQDEIGDLRTGVAAAAPQMVDLAITLHRLGDPTREVGARLFERLLEVDAYSARDTLDEIDNRLPDRTSAPRRPRVPRRVRRTARR